MLRDRPYCDEDVHVVLSQVKIFARLWQKTTKGYDDFHYQDMQDEFFA
jgi:hypothetical protein